MRIIAIAHDGDNVLESETVMFGPIFPEALTSVTRILMASAFREFRNMFKKDPAYILVDYEGIGGFLLNLENNKITFFFMSQEQARLLHAIKDMLFRSGAEAKEECN